MSRPVSRLDPATREGRAAQDALSDVLADVLIRLARDRRQEAPAA